MVLAGRERVGDAAEESVSRSWLSASSREFTSPENAPIRLMSLTPRQIKRQNLRGAFPLDGGLGANVKLNER